MTATNYRETMAAVREQGARRGLASDLSATIRRLDLLDRRETLRERDAPQLAAMILDHEAARKALGTARVQKDERYKFWASEVEILGREVGERIRKYLQSVPDAKFLTSTPTAWARATLRQAKKEADAALQRRAARAAQPTRTGGKKRTALLSLKRLTTKSATTGRPQVMLTASSTSVDMDSDRFSLSALQDMKRGLKNRAAFIGHRYDPSTDIFGKIVASDIVAKGAKTVLDLVVDVSVENPRASAVLDLIKSGVPIGASVGVLVLRSVKDKTDPEVTVLDSVKPLEVSVVGLPSNWEDGWVTSVKGKRADLDNLVVA